MTRWSLFLSALLLSVSAHAAPFLYADPYSTTNAPDSATFTVNGGTPQPCELITVQGGIRPKCDLGGITAAGTYTLVMTVSRAASIVNGTNTATNTAAGSASSANFTYVLRTEAVGGPTLRVAP